jgi:hypothetical protein
VGGTGADGFVVHPEALKEFGHTSQQRGHDFQHCYNEAKTLTVDADAFGHLPIISDRVREAYDSHVQTCQTAILAAASTMFKVSKEISVTVANYKKADTTVEDALSAVGFGFDPAITDTP